MSPTHPPRYRWPSLALLVIAIAASLASVWMKPDTMTQQKVMYTGGLLVPFFLLLLLWAFFIARFSSRTRTAIATTLVVAILGSFALFDVRGVTGDLVPILSWRFSSAPLFETPGATPSSRSDDVAKERPWRDSPQFLGPNGDSIYPSVTLDRNWETHPPQLRWRREVGAAWSGFAIRGDDAITQEQRDVRECVVCYDVTSGEPKWIHEDATRYDSVVGGIGPRATPTITDAIVVTVGATGLLNALDRKSGTMLWQHDLLKEHGAAQPDWGVAGSPLVIGEHIYVATGGREGSLAIYNLSSGELLARGGDDHIGYSSPQLRHLAGVDQILLLNGSSVTGHDPKSAAVLWTYPWSHLNPNVAQPWPVEDDQLFASSGYGVGGELLRIVRNGDRFDVERVWQSRSLKAKFANFVVIDSYIYGLDDGILTCVDLSDGSRQWKRGRYGHGQVTSVGELLLITGEFGTLHLVEPTPAEHREVASFTWAEEKSWNPPTVAPPLLFLRTELEAFCFELPTQPE